MLLAAARNAPKTSGLKLLSREAPGSRSVDLVAKFGCTASPVKAGLWPPPPAADGLDRVCRPAVVCHHEIDGKVWQRANFKPLAFVYFQAAVDTVCMRLSQRR